MRARELGVVGCYIGELCVIIEVNTYWVDELNQQHLMY